ncbi:MAG: PEP-CTERM sorting domain-containing protein [Planctomycetes bacterium]|nr:PEP-CTERM sorting domain-containing protein [Planctomycetota bacterium]
MKYLRLVVRHLDAGSLAAVAALALLVAPASAALIRNFNSGIPAGDSLVGGAVLSATGSPGSPSKQLNNTASPGFGNLAPNYDGHYLINNANLIGGLGTSSLGSFTIKYAYKNDNPNSNAGDSRRQLRMFNTTTAATVIDIGQSAGRQGVTINGVSFGTPAFNPSSRLMDGDPLTMVNAPPATSGTGTFNGANATEWVFFAMTYEAVSPTLARVTEYGMPESQVSFGLRQFHVNTLTVANSSIPLTDLALQLANGTFSPTTNRPSDASFDAFGFFPSALTFADMETMAKMALVEIPEPSSMLMTLLGVVGLLGAARRRQEG